MLHNEDADDPAITPHLRGGRWDLCGLVFSAVGMHWVIVAHLIIAVNAPRLVIFVIADAVIAVWLSRGAVKWLVRRARMRMSLAAVLLITLCFHGTSASTYARSLDARVIFSEPSVEPGIYGPLLAVSWYASLIAVVPLAWLIARAVQARRSQTQGADCVDSNPSAGA